MNVIKCLKSDCEKVIGQFTFAFLLHSNFSYVQYSTIAARAVRQVLKGEAKEAGAKRGDITNMRMN